MAYLIDTNIAIHARDGDDDRVLDELAAHDGQVMLSALSLAELERGVERDRAATVLRRARLDRLLRNIPILPFDAAAARAYGRIIADLGWVRGRDFDRMIAGHALAIGLILVTSNVADFRDIPELMIENWSSAA